ncbi:ATP-binding protein [Butyrivibrio sp. YAB3001]|uniref:ATP-binding protein n=1 Tax=Butyrivibrio sp. YAB3001 TaxID=1520812 RepID=UPI0008F64FB4|nr:ATP-binding protein [Butyrivibrio sp. YAB3001]SFB73037.1 PD-(D/E)XK nuclease superfamily protein [Butyrivibrio sp. YAB3001]
MHRKLPIGIQAFEKLREERFVYVDKTEYVYTIAHSNVPYFLSRPRRFGKSLLLSTMQAYWEGKKNLFTGLRIEELEKDNADAWKTYPVFYFDFNGQNYLEENALEKTLDIHLKRWEEQYDISGKEKGLGERFQDLLLKAHEKTGLRCVVLVDEYDKPLLDVVENEDIQEHNKAVCKGFFSTLKSFDNHIQSVFITGVTKFHKVSIFSDLNQLNDISLNKQFAGICGLTDDELENFFKSEIQDLADSQELSYDECKEQLRIKYDGYHFCTNGVAVYNPFSILKAFDEMDFGSYWFETGTPTFLIKRLKKSGFDARRFTDRTIYASESALKDYTEDNLDQIPLLYQTGYLSIADYDKKVREYTLAFPNEEVKYGFLESLMPEYVGNYGSSSGLDIFTFRRCIEDGNLDRIRDILTGLFANITYTVQDDPFEHYFQTVIYLVFTLLGKFTVCEMHTFTGRIDCVVQASKFIYLFEFKRDDTADSALVQIEDKEYDLPFKADSRKLYKIGVSFDSGKRNISEWKILE